ncbi:Hypothetical protein CINCED_3A011695 [Cinara cedri]|uniref:Uncharacterized protein n=1 Tax=Cinara cedri TaxID=506608 RepID=A0A5E4NKZ2_9HEMI|nr:Hypothetical protein CINCED_3A011695 [Cinara cedri]
MERANGTLVFISKIHSVRSVSMSELTVTDQNKVLASQQPEKDDKCNNQVDCTTVSTNDPKIKSALKGIRFESMEEVKQKSVELLNGLTKTDFQHCLEQWKKRMKRYFIRRWLNEPWVIHPTVAKLWPDGYANWEAVAGTVLLDKHLGLILSLRGS